jgi:hypothetical protein
VSTEFRRHGIEPEITSVFRGMPKCHFRGHPRDRAKEPNHTTAKMGLQKGVAENAAKPICCPVLNGRLPMLSCLKSV